MLKVHKKDLIVFFLLFIICTIAVLIWYPELDLDFYNYQLYNGWAYLNHRLDIDFMPAGFRSYWNPYLDIFQYIMATKLNNHRFIYAILMNLDTVLGLFLTYKVADKILLDNIKNRNLSLGLIIFYVMFSPVMYRILDSTKNDMVIADLILISFYVFLNIFDKNKNKTFFTAISGLIIGIAIGLKLTAIVYALTFLFCLICLFKTLDRPIKLISIFILSMLTAFFIVDGHWLYTIYSKFQNPFFPVFNNIFHSPFSDFTNIYEGDFNQIRPQNLYQLFFYPFLWSKDFCYGSHNKYFDLRYAINIVFIGLILFAYFKKFNFPVKNQNFVWFLTLFCFFSYETNVFLFGVYRYIVASCLLFGLITFLTLSFLISDFKFFSKYKLTSFMIFMILIVQMSQQIHSFPGMPKFELFKPDKTILLKIPNYNISDDSYVLIGGFGTAGNLINQNINAKYVQFIYPKFIYYNKLKQYENVLGFYSMFYFSDYAEENLKKILQSNKKAYIFFRTRDIEPFLEVTHESVNYYSRGSRKIDNCQNIFAEPSLSKYIESYNSPEDISFYDYVLCELKRN